MKSSIVNNEFSYSMIAASRTRIYEAFVYILINEPSAAVLEAYSNVSRLLETDRSSADEIAFNQDITALKQIYYDRFFVTTSPIYLPLSEQSIRSAVIRDNRIEFGRLKGTFTDHVVEYYKAAGFEYRNLIGFEPTIASLSADSLISEIAFLGYLSNRESEAANTNVKEKWQGLRTAFMSEHIGKWMGTCAEILSLQKQDLYAKTVSLLSDFLLLDEQYSRNEQHGSAA
jgi:hypothetical protein